MKQDSLNIKINNRSRIYLFRILLFFRHSFVIYIIGIFFISTALSSCEKFFNPEYELIIESNKLYENWEEYRAAELGLYSLQQNLVEQLLILGELRGDLLEITDNATPELVEIYNFNISKDNPYASPVNFYKLIDACNKLIRQLKSAHPSVVDKTQPVNNYDRLYGEVLCMRAWAYFNAVRIYGEVPYIYESLNSVEEIESYVNSESEFSISEYIIFAPDGFQNDTIRDTTIVLNKMFLNQKAVIDTFTNQLENNIKAVGIDHSINNGDISWQSTVWSDYARHALLGQMYLFDGNYTKTIEHFYPFLYNYSSETSDIRFGLDNRFAGNSWKNIFDGVDTYEQIYTIWFGKSYQQNHNIQKMLSVIPPNDYMMKPTALCIKKWETIWDNPKVDLDSETPQNSVVTEPGIPGDFSRGYGVSYMYYKNGQALSADIIQEMLIKKMRGELYDVEVLMNDIDTVATKYSIGRDENAHDANFIIYRAANIHLYAAEIYALWVFDHNGIIRPETNTSLNILNDGRYADRDEQLGVRGRVGFADGYEAINIEDIVYIHDPLTNEIIGYDDFSGNLDGKQKYLVDMILEERARELAFEGERFYDIMRIAKRRGDPSYLADKIAAKFSDAAQKERIRNKLMNEQNWYINYFE